MALFFGQKIQKEMTSLKSYYIITQENLLKEK